jgi:hypothetical protein
MWVTNSPTRLAPVIKQKLLRIEFVWNIRTQCEEHKTPEQVAHENIRLGPSLGALSACHSGQKLEILITCSPQVSHQLQYSGK